MPGFKMEVVTINYQSPAPGIPGGQALSIITDDGELLNAAKSHETVMKVDAGFKENETHLFAREDVNAAKEAIQRQLVEIIHKRP